MLNHIVRVGIYELQRNLRRKGFLFSAFGLPIIAFVLFMVVNQLTSRTNEQAVEDLARQAQEDLAAVRQAGYVDESGLFTVEAENAPRRYTSETAAQDAMNAGEIELYYVIRADYAETGEAYVVLPDFSINMIELLDTPIRQLLFSQFEADADADVLARLQMPASIQEVTFDQGNSDGRTRDEGGDFLLVYGFALIFMIALFGTNGYLMQSVIEEKESRLVEILITSVRPLALLMGKIIALGLLGILQIAAWLGTIVVMSRLAAQITEVQSPLLFLQNINLDPANLLLLLIYFVLGYLFFAAAFGAIGAMSQSLTEGPSYSAVFTIPIVLPLLFLTQFIDAPNAAGPTLLSIIPLTAPIAMPMRLALVDVPFLQVMLSIALLIVLDIGMMWLAGRIFRAQSLLAGQVPKLKDLPALLRG